MLDIITIKDVKMKIGEWCKKQRIEHEASQEHLALELNMSRLTIQQLESGKNVTIDTLLKVANHFNSLPAIYQVFDTSASDNLDSLY